MAFSPKAGIRKKPVMKVPKMLPAVDQVNRFPVTVPRVSDPLEESLTA